MSKKIKKALKKKRYFGIVTLPKAIRFCWVSKQDKNGWSLGFALDERTVWVTGIRFETEKEVEKAMKSNIVFVHLKNN
jgi:hypothetical protein